MLGAWAIVLFTFFMGYIFRPVVAVLPKGSKMVTILYTNIERLVPCWVQMYKSKLR